MGQGLHANFPAFTRAWDTVSAEFAKHLDHTLTDVYLGGGGAAAELVDDPLYAQAGIFAVEVALVELLAEWGVRPDVVTGHSIGEAAAAYTAGMFSLADVTALITIRGTALRSAPPGAMLALQAGEPEVRDFLDHTGAALDVAAVNGPAAVVVSGAPDAVAGFASAWTASGRKCRQLKVRRAFHSRHVEGVLGDFRTVLESLTFRTPALPIVSTVTGRLIDPAEMGTPEYWLRQVRQPVRFQNALGELAGQGVGAFLEVGPSGTLASAGMECLDASFHALLRPRSAEDAGVLTALAELYAGGTAVDWATVLAGGRPVDLPVYPFQHQSYWLMSAAPERTVAPAEPAEPDVPDEPRTVLELVHLEVASILGITDPDAVQDDSSFLELGFDSLNGVRLRNRLAQVFGLTLPATLLFDHDTPGALATELDALLASDMDAAGVFALLEEVDELDEEAIDMTAEERRAIADLLAKLSAKWKVKG
jgi:acyl transferase domain-containing protein